MRCITFVYILLVFVHSTPTVADDLPSHIPPPGWKWTSTTENSVIAQGVWIEDRFRFADASHRYTTEDQSSLKWKFDGSSIAIRLAGQNTSSYPGTGLPSHGKLYVYIDGTLTNTISRSRGAGTYRGDEPFVRPARTGTHASLQT